MKNAGKAMKEIHGGMTIEQVDKTMDELREQQQLGEEIATAITSAPIGEPVDEGELEEELEGLEQEMLDERMVGSKVPVGGELERAPAVPSGNRKWNPDVAGRRMSANVGLVANKKVQEDDEEEELRKLQAEMAM